MAYEKIEKPKGFLYHYTKRENLNSILQEGRIRRFNDLECWFCTSLKDTLRLMEMTVMNEGHPYIDVKGILRRYPAFVAEDYVILKLEPQFSSGEWIRWNQEMPPGCPPEKLAEAAEFSLLKKGYRGDLKFKNNPEVLEAAPLIIEQAHQPAMTMK